MNKGINKNLRKKVLKRDNFTCEKCKIKDRTGKILEIHHIVPLCKGRDDSPKNLITLCYDCHHYAPNDEKGFKEYMGEEINGTFTTLLKSWHKVRKEHPELFKQLDSL